MLNTPEAWDRRAVSVKDPAHACLWSEQGQTVRMQAVRGYLALESGQTVLDFGCGTGRFCDFLPHRVAYFGYDWSEEMRRRTLRDHRLAVGLRSVGNLRFDHVVCIGTFNLADGWSHEQTHETILDLWERNTMHSLVVSLYRGYDPSCLVYSADWVASLALEMGGSIWTVDQSHLTHDIILAVRK
jgi:SAM-dependent methyltransferase